MDTDTRVYVWVIRLVAIGLFALLWTMPYEAYQDGMVIPVRIPRHWTMHAVFVLGIGGVLLPVDWKRHFLMTCVIGLAGFVLGSIGYFSGHDSALLLGILPAIGMAGLWRRAYIP